jgi:nicotinate phosphoribosyltransferase
VAAGLEQALEHPEHLRFTPQELEWLARSGRFSRDFVDSLEHLRFTGDAHAMAEGTIFFPPEPVLRVTAPMPRAQLVETRLINLLHFKTIIASKAARMVLVAPAKGLIDLGLQRAHGAEAGVLAARACYLAGFTGSATVLAGLLYGVPVYGTMARSFVQAHDEEPDAFERFAHAQPGNVVLLIDTYDTEAAAEKVVALASHSGQQGITIKGVRLDSRDLADLARMMRRILAGGNLDEEAVRTLVSSEAPIDDFAIGTRLDTSADASSLDCGYKLQEYAGRACRKRSTGEATWPGRQQVYRIVGPDGRMPSDTVTLEVDLRAGEPLQLPVMRGGQCLGPSPSLEEIRQHAASELARLPEHLRQLQVEPAYPVVIAQALRNLAEAVDRRTTPSLSRESSHLAPVFPFAFVLQGIVTPGARTPPSASGPSTSRPWDGMACHVTSCPTVMLPVDAWTAYLSRRALPLGQKRSPRASHLDGKHFAPDSRWMA